MLKTIGLFLLLISGNVFAQRVYVHEIKNGNYRSYEKGSRIVLYLLDSSTKISGTVSKIEQDGFYLQDGTYIPVNQIASILPPNTTKSLKRFVSVVGGSILLFTGTIYFIAGAAGLKDEPVLGAGIMVASAGIFVGGMYILRKSKITHKQVPQCIIDNITYRVFIE